MGKAKVDFRQFEKFVKQFESLTNEDFEELCKDIVKRLAAELLKKVKPRTPVNQSLPNDVNFHGGGGTLQNAWTIGNVLKNGGVYCVEVINPTHYAPFVEKGHRGVYVPEVGVTLHLDTHWTEGVFMLTIAEEEIAKVADKFVELKLDKFIKRKLR